MKVIVCGAGQVGFNIARHLSSEGTDVVVVDQSNELVQKVSDSLDVQALQGHASHPDVLETAGAGDADMVIAVTQADEVNMVACQVCHSLFNVPTKIARVRNQSYLAPIWSDLFSRNHLPIDVIISPEIEVARAVSRRMQIPGAFDVIPLADDKVRALGIRCNEQCPLINTPLRHLTTLFPDLNIVIVGILRDGRPIVPTGDDQMLVGDEVYFVCDTQHVPRAMSAFGKEAPEARRLIIAGGGNIGLCLAQDIEETHTGVNVKVIEINRERAQSIAQQLNQTVVINGDALDPQILSEVNISAAETLIAVTEDDENNILVSLLAKRYGCQRAVTLINTNAYTPLIPALDLDVVVSPRALTVSTILQHIRRGRIRSVHSLGEDFGEIIEADALETSSLVGKPLKDVHLPPGVVLGAIIREGEVVIPRGSTVVRTRDRVVLFAQPEVVKKVEKMFAVRLEYF